MEQQRLFFLFALAIVGYFLYDFWTDFQDAKNAPPAPAMAESTTNVPDESVIASSDFPTADAPLGDNSMGDDEPTISSASDIPVTTNANASATGNSVNSTGEIVKVTTDLIEAEIDLRGGGLSSLKLRKYPIDLDKPDVLTPLLDASKATGFYGRINEAVYSKGQKNYWNQPYQAAQNSYQLITKAAEDQDELGASGAEAAKAETLRVPLTSEFENLKVERSYNFVSNEYLITVNTRITNTGSQPWQGNVGTRLGRNGFAKESDVPFVSTFTGMAMSARDDENENEYQDFDFEDLNDVASETPSGKINAKAQGGWAAMVQHYYLVATLPNKSDLNSYQIYRNKKDQYYYAVTWSPSIMVAPGETVEVTRDLYIGPKIQDRLNGYADDLTDTVDYGILAPLAEPLFWVMNFIHNFIGIWGLVIILVTLLVKALFYKLTEAQYKSMAKMRAFSPRIKALKERYGDDRQRQQQEMMKLFKKEKINPLGGCLPILLQMPVFIALYWVLLESVELKYASFLWLPDLTQPDQYFILPILFAVSMFAQQRLSASTATMDPMQAKIMSLLPFFLGVFFAFFPSGLVLYWVVNNLISMLQQWYINRKIDNEQNRKAIN